MTTGNDEFRTSLVAAVQAELDRHAGAVVRELEAVRRDVERDRADLVARLDEQARQIALSVQSGGGAPDDGGHQRSRASRNAPDQQLEAMERRLLDHVRQVRQEVSTAIEATVNEMADRVLQPFASELRREVAALTERVTTLDGQLADFDSQAARMVTYVSETTARLDRRQDELAARVGSDTEERLSALRQLVDQQSGEIRSARSEVEARLIDVTGSIGDLGTRLSEAETTLRSDVADRVDVLEQSVRATIAETSAAISAVDVRLGAVDDRLGAVDERAGAVDERLAAVDVGLGAVDEWVGAVDERLAAVDERLVASDERVGAVDERLAAVDDRLGAVDDRLLETERRTRAVADSVATIDLEAIDTMKEKLSTAAGEAMLVRIEMERFEKTIGERSDQLAVRLTEVETTLQDTTLDVAASVQLDRLEEIERALAELDPEQFVRKDGNATDPTATAPLLDDATQGVEVGDPEMLTLASAESIMMSDEPRLPQRPGAGGSDSSRDGIDAIIAAAESVNEREV